MDIAKQISAMMKARNAESLDQLLEIFKIMGADLEIKPILDGGAPDESEIRAVVAECEKQGSKLVNIRMNLKGKSVFGMLVLPC